MRLPKLVRLLLYGLAAIIILPVVQEIPIEIARSLGLYDFPREGVREMLSNLAENTYYIIIAAFTIGMAVGATIHWIATNIEKRRPSRKTARLVMYVPADSSVPSMAENYNVWRWFWFTYMVRGISDDGSQRVLGEAPVLFINFDEPVAVTSLIIKSHDCVLPLYDIKEFKSRFAIIFFEHNFGPGTLEIEVRSPI